jgi:hypothetical protein
MPYFVNNSQHWRDRAAEARIIAEQLTDAGARENMLAVADAYERMAERAEKHPILEKNPTTPPSS